MLLKVLFALFVGIEPLPVPVIVGVVAFTEMEKVLLAVAVAVALTLVGALLVVAFAVTIAEWVCRTVVPFSVHRLVKVVY